MDHTDHHNNHSHHSVKMFKDKFWLSFALSVPVVIYSPSVQDWFGFQPPLFPGASFIPLLLGTVIFFYGGLVFIKGSLQEVRDRRPGMMTLISIAITAAYVYSVAAVLILPGEGFFWELATLVTIMLLGHWLEMASVERAGSALQDISKLLPDTALKFIDDSTKEVKTTELKVGDIVLVKPGSAVPADGNIIEGEASVDESAITGESKPETKTEGNPVVAGTIDLDGTLKIEVSKTGDDTALANIMRLVKEAQESKSKTQILADKAAFALTLIAVGASLITFIVWTIISGSGFALERAVTVLVIACPHALGLAIPIVVAISTSKAAKNGLLIRRRLALESAKNLNWVLFDKTGTLTKGQHGVTDIWTTKNYSEDKLLQLAASLEHMSEHIIAEAIVKNAEQRDIKLDKVHGFSAMSGQGVKGTVREEPLAVTNFNYVNSHIKLPPELRESTDQASRDGKTIVYVLRSNKVIGAIGLADIIRDESYETIQALKHQGIRSAMITGDSKQVADHVARQLELNQYFAEVLPNDKSDKVKELQREGNVAMVGDGVNDAPALTQATIGIAIGAGTDIAINSADIILINNNPLDVMKIINLSKMSYRKMLQNLMWATGYNIIAIPLAAGVLAGIDIILSPAVGAVLMTVSTVVVALNAQLLRRKEL